jgi:hypothetical protein
MHSFTHDQSFFTAYDSLDEFFGGIGDMVYHCYEPVCEFLTHGFWFLYRTLPWAITIFIGITSLMMMPMMLLSLSLALSLMSYTTPVMIALIALTALDLMEPAYDFAATVYAGVDLILTIMIDVFSILSNVLATGLVGAETLAENFANAMAMN